MTIPIYQVDVLKHGFSVKTKYLGAFEFGFVYTADGTVADDDVSYGVKFSGGNWSVGFVGWEDEGAIGTESKTKTQVGATYQLGDIGLGLTVGDNDATTDSGGVDFGLYMPLGAGNLAVVLSSLDADTKRVMKAITALLPPEARVQKTPTRDELLATFPPGYSGDPEAEYTRRPGED